MECCDECEMCERLTASEAECERLRGQLQVEIDARAYMECRNADLETMRVIFEGRKGELTECHAAIHRVWRALAVNPDGLRDISEYVADAVATRNDALSDLRTARRMAWNAACWLGWALTHHVPGDIPGYEKSLAVCEEIDRAYGQGSRDGGTAIDGPAGLVEEEG